MENGYLNEASMQRAVGKGGHRAIVGGSWDAVGHLQFDFMTGHGLKPHHRFIDVGCGCLRGGVHFVGYLEQGNYFGVDASQALIDAGINIELAKAGLEGRLPRDNVVCTNEFDFSAFAQPFDYGLALSVFTHLSFNTVRVCLERLAPAMSIGGVFFASYFLVSDGPTHRPLVHKPGGIVTHGSKDPFHYRTDDFRHAISGLPWALDDLGDWGHPRDQRMLAFTRLA